MLNRLRIAVVMLALVASPGAAGLFSSSSLTALASNPLVSSLMSGLGLNPTQAVGGAGALLGLAQAKMPKADWSKLAKLVPGASSLISQAKTLGGIKQFTNLAGLAPAFGKMGLSADQVKTIQPEISSFISKAGGAGGADLAKKFDAAIK